MSRHVVLEEGGAYTNRYRLRDESNLGPFQYSLKVTDVDHKIKNWRICELLVIQDVSMSSAAWRMITSFMADAVCDDLPLNNLNRETFKLPSLLLVSLKLRQLFPPLFPICISH